MISLLEVRCERLTPGHEVTPVEATSCGLDLWHSSAGLHWASSYLQAEAIIFRITDGHQQANLTCLLRGLLGGLSLASAYPYGRIDGDVGLFWRAAPMIAKALRHERIVRLEIPFSGAYAHQLGLAPASAISRVTKAMKEVRHVLDMAECQQDKLDACFDANARWAVRKALRNGCTVRPAIASDVDTLQSLYASTMRAKHAPVNYGRERWAGIANALATNGQGALYIGEIEGRPRGMAAAVDGAISRHLIQLAVPPDAHSSRLGELLVSTAIHDAHAKGIRYFDFMASSASDVGLLAFKAKWGTQAEPIQYAIIPSLPVFHHIVDLGRWANRTRARFRGT